MRALGIRSIFGAACAFLVACGSHHGGEDPATATLSISPPTSMLQIVNLQPATEDFTATLTFADGKKQDVTAETTFTIQDPYGSFTGPTLSMVTAGKATVSGVYIDKQASAVVIAQLKAIRIGTGVDPNAPGWFSMPEDPTRAPTVKYPANNSIMPRNVGDFEVHWTDASNNDTWEVSLTTDYADIRAYVKGGNGVAAAGPDPSWMAFLSTEWMAAVGAEPQVQFQVRGVNSASPTAVGSAQPQIVKLSNEALNGGIYYWASTSTSQTEPYGIYRHDMSLPGQPAQQYMTTAQTTSAMYPKGRCVACHVLSRDGKEMLVTFDGGDGPATTVNVGTATTATSVTGWNFATFTPDGTQFLGVHDGVLKVYDYASQAVLATMTTAGAQVTHPDLSPDGTQLVYVRPGVYGNDWTFGSGQIWIRSYNQATHTFGAERMLVGDTANNYYPSFSPDGMWVLFNKGNNYVNGNQNMSYNGPAASLWVVKSDGSAPAVELATANQAIGLTNSWGRWAPFAQSFGANNEQMYWVTVSSKRDFGVRLVGANQPQIWMTPFFPDHATQLQDPSAVAFRLPFQDITSNNHIAQWTQQVVNVQ